MKIVIKDSKKIETELGSIVALKKRVLPGILHSY